MAQRFNPFSPNGPIAPGMFQGRIAEIEAIEKCLFQAKNGNPVHFLIQGERGIGKSSLFYLIDAEASGRIDVDGELFKFLVVSVDLGGATTQMDIVRTIGRELRSGLDQRNAFKAKAKKFWEWATGWEVLGVRYHTNPELFDPLEAADALIAAWLNAIKSVREKTGLPLPLAISDPDHP